MGLLDSIKGFAVDRAYEVKALSEVASADKDGDGKLSLDEYKAISPFGGDQFSPTKYLFDTIDELDGQLDGRVSVKGLSEFYKKADTNKDLEINGQEMSNAMAKSSWSVKLQNPLMAVGNALGHLMDQIQIKMTTPQK